MLLAPFHSRMVWNRVATTSPPVRKNHALATDFTNSNIVAFGGIDALGVEESDTWIWDPVLIPGALHFAVEEIDSHHAVIPRDRDVVLYCT